MAPIVLKVKGNMESLPFGSDPSEDLSKTWRVCTKVKDSLENGSRLENLSWRLWFAHNINDCKRNRSASALLRNFRIPDNFDFPKASQQNKKKKKSKAELEAEYRRTLMVQQTKQAEQKIQDAKKFTLQQFTSDQSGDQVIELEDIFKSLGGDMQAYLNPSEENPTAQQLDTLINASWPVSSDNRTPSYQESFHEETLYVSSEAMPPIPIGTLRNKLLTTLPKETLESAGRLLNKTDTMHQKPTESNHSLSYPSLVQSTPNTPYHTTSSSFPP
ncbi:hypothetical protein EDC96DRAFT_415382, partial [Choanephora cucurbitarum]